MVIILMVTAKMATPRLLKIRLFRKKGYDVIISAHDVTNKISRDSNYNGVIPTFAEVIEEKLVGGNPFCPRPAAPPPILNRVKNKKSF